MALEIEDPIAAVHQVDWLLQAAVATWLFAFGAAVGSFLNVVAYRLPRGASLIYPGSACPRCGQSIRWYDNIPIWGWIRLGGRCRDCRAPISIRYPLVEAATAGSFVLLAWSDLFLTHLHWLVLVRHLLLVSLLLTAALIELDGSPVPLGMLVLAAGLGVVIPLRAPIVDQGLESVIYQLAIGWRESLRHLGVAASISALAWPLFGRGPRALRAASIALCETAMVGALESWNVAALASAAAAIGVAVWRSPPAPANAESGEGRAAEGWARWLGPATLALLVVRPLAGPWASGLWNSKRPLALVGAAVIALASAVSWFRDRGSPPTRYQA